MTTPAPKPEADQRGIKPCPCGKEPILIDDYNEELMNVVNMVTCQYCGNTGPMGYTPEQAIATWNERKP